MKLTGAYKAANKMAPLRGQALHSWLYKAAPLVKEEAMKGGDMEDEDYDLQNLFGDDDDGFEDIASAPLDAEDVAEAPPDVEPGADATVADAADVSPEIAAVEEDTVTPTFQLRLDKIQSLLKTSQRAPVGIEPNPVSDGTFGEPIGHETDEGTSSRAVEGGSLHTGLPAFPSTRHALKTPHKPSLAKEFGQRYAGGNPLPMAMPQGSQQALEALHPSIPAGVIMYNYGGSSRLPQRLSK